MYNHILYLAYWGVNTAAIFVLNRLFPEEIVLGVNKFVPVESAVYSGFWLTFFVWTLWDLAVFRKIKLSPKPVAFIFFLIANCFGILVISLASKYTGMKIWGWWIWGAALTTNIFQRWVWSRIVGR